MDVQVERLQADGRQRQSPSVWTDLVEAQSTGIIESLAGAASLGSNAATGAASDVNVVGNTTAEIASSSTQATSTCSWNGSRLIAHSDQAVTKATTGPIPAPELYKTATRG